MPTQRKYARRRRYRRRPRYGRKRYYRRKRTFTPQRSLLEGMPARKLAKLRYVEEITINPTAGSIASHNFRASDVFDPNATGIGTQPQGYDQLMAWYEKHTVLGSKITVTHVPDGTSAVTPAYVGVLTSLDGSQIAGMSTVKQLLMSKNVGRNWKIISAHSPPGQSWKGYPMITKKFSAKKFFGVKDVLGEDDYSGQGALPLELAYFEVFAAAVQGNDPGTIPLTVTIDYIVMFHARKTLNAS